MKEWIKCETDDSGYKVVLSIKATRYTTMMMISRLLLNLATESKGEQSVGELLTDLKVIYIPIMTKMAGEKMAHEEVTKTE